MPWWAWLLLGLYLVAYVLAFRRIAGQWAWHFAANGFYSKRDFPSGEQWFGGIAMGAILGLIWPLSVPVALGLASARQPGRGLFYTPPNVREKLYKERIAELEREAGIR